MQFFRFGFIPCYDNSVYFSLGLDLAKAKRMLKNFMIKTAHQSIEYKIIGLSDSRCKDQLFDMRVKNGDGANKGHSVAISVYDYFLQHYNIQLQYSAYMPCVDVGKPERPKYLPLELCTLIPDQCYTKALSLMQRASLAKKSRPNPQAVGNQKDDPVLAEFHISIEKQLTQVEGRILETPKLKVGNNEDCIPCNGRWNFNSKKLYEPTRIERWVVVNFLTPRETFLFSQELINCGRDMGIVVYTTRLFLSTYIYQPFSYLMISLINAAY
ncbi:protein argonaute 16-like isoform X3 [Quercus lobata]|uniref:protein argonaute 16-like isoform X3 n=1 Tax=Quercus lobata TaxID=97700 RepID=UPI0012458580|nr:protein argonaute 16-like isoform X3 [Quercus lobata]